MRDCYTETINTLMDSIYLDDKLCSHILDIIPKLVEARARHWIKGEHGYFAGSYSDGKSGAGNGLTKGGGSGIIAAGAFNPLPQDKVVNVLRKESRDWINSLSDEEIRAVMKYTFNSADTVKPRFYERLNAMLRGDIPEDKTLRYYADVISSALKKNVLKHDIVCYRSMDFDVLSDYSVGDIYFPKQFFSTSVTLKGSFCGEYQTIIHTLAGTKGAYVEVLSAFPNQREYLLDKDCVYRVISKTAKLTELEVII